METDKEELRFDLTESLGIDQSVFIERSKRILKGLIDTKNTKEWVQSIKPKTREETLIFIDGYIFGRDIEKNENTNKDVEKTILQEIKKMIKEKK